MSKLVSVEELRNELQYDDVEKLNAVLDFALETATGLLASVLRTGFDLVTNQVDLFFPRWVVQLGSNGETTCYLRLSQANLTAAAVTGIYSATVSGLTSTPTTLDSSNYTVDRQHGLVTVRGIDLTELFVQMTYTAGFALSNEVYVGVPDWLKNLTKLQALVVIANSAPKVVADAFDTNQKDMLQMQLDQAVRANSRYYPKAEKPL